MEKDEQKIDENIIELQKENRRLNKLIETDWLTGVYTVSYTHLDVYKRQR